MSRYCLLVAYFAWRLVVAGDGLVLIAPDSGRKLVGSVKRVIPEQEILLEVINSDRENSITEISMSRQLVNGLGLSESAGFREEPLPLTESDRKNKELVEFMEEFNKETTRRVGRLALVPIPRLNWLFRLRLRPAFGGIWVFNMKPGLASTGPYLLFG